MADPDALEKIKSEAVDDLKRTATIDTLHNDEGVRVLANYTGDTEWDDAEEKKLVKKIDRKLLSIVVTTYGLQYYDKAMLSQAVSIVMLQDDKYISMLTIDTCTGSVRPSRGSRLGGRQPVLHERGHLLPGLHCGRVSGHRHGAAISDRTRPVRDRVELGRLPHVHRGLH